MKLILLTFNEFKREKNGYMSLIVDELCAYELYRF